MMHLILKHNGIISFTKGKHTYTGEYDFLPPSFSNCTSILTDFELSTGDYTVVTAFDHSPSTLMNMIMVRNQNDDGFDILFMVCNLQKFIF